MTRALALTAVIIFGLDQLTKYLVVHGMNLRSVYAIDVFPPFLQFRMAWNHGVNFGLFAGPTDTTRWILIAIALAISVWVLIWMRREPDWRAQLAAGLLIGGAMGNVIDRIVYGAVADFLNMSCCGIQNPFSFNIADIAIFVGALGLVVFAGGDKTS